MYTILCKRRLRWLGHVKRMDDTRIPKQLLYGEMAQGSRQRGRPKLRYKDKCKSSMVKCNINPTNWEQVATDRSAWKSAVRKGAQLYENNTISDMIEKRQRRKENPPEPCGTSLSCNHCNRNCSSNIGRISHERSCKERQKAKSC